MTLLHVRTSADPGSIGLQGELDVSTAAVVSAVIDEQLERGVPSLHVDLSSLTFIDSSGARALTNAAARAAKRGVEVVAEGVRGSPAKILKLLGAVDPLCEDAYVVRHTRRPSSIVR